VSVAGGGSRGFALRALGLFALGLFALMRPTEANASLQPYSEAAYLLATTPSTDDGATGAIFNPAQWGILERSELAGFWERDLNRPSGSSQERWGFAIGRTLGFSMRREDRHRDSVSALARGANHVTDYQVGLGAGSREHHTGVAFGFSGHGKGASDRTNYVTFGSIRRPTRWLSFGSTVDIAIGEPDLQTQADVGIRPFSDPRLLLFADYALRRNERWDDGDLALGAAVRPLEGVFASLRWEPERGSLGSDRFRVTVGLGLGRASFRATPHYVSGGDHRSTSYVARLNPPQRGIDVDRLTHRGRRTLALPLKGDLVYQSYRWFDRDALPLRDVIERLQFAIDDPTVGAVAVNLSGFGGSLAMAWEIREKLLQVKKAGKRVTISCDNLDARSAYIASSADTIVMDPRGSLLMPGVAASRTYLHALLEKMGIGFEEWRFYKYKSALETFSRETMSEADREQYGAMLRAAYEELARAYTSSGRVARPEFDRVVNEEPYTSAARLHELRWIEKLGRWEDVERDLERSGRGTPASYRALRELRWRPREDWGRDPTIALVYLIGDCSMDHGINARGSSRALRAFRESRAVDAVVLRVDSPGGDPLASDLVAGETRKLRRAEKPVVVSQGRVAGSGGYWISMDGEPILASPFTLTGSIGVIGGWAWNKGFGRKAGLTSDHVQEGKSADLLTGLRIPLLGATLPERNLDDRERRLIQRGFDELYGDFVGKVAAARGLDSLRVRELAEGRVYDGAAAVRLRLADRLGTLDDAIQEAKRRAGVKPDAVVRILEYPKRPLFRLPAFLRGPIGGSARSDQAASGEPTLLLEVRALQSILDQPGRPLLVMPGPLLPPEPEAVR
jgi:protease-4